MITQRYQLFDEFLIIGCVDSYIPSEECKPYNCSINISYIVARPLLAHNGLGQKDYGFLSFSSLRINMRKKSLGIKFDILKIYL